MEVSIAAKLTWVFPSLVPLDEADNEEDQDEQGDGTHQADEPSLSSNVHLSASHGWPGGRGKLSFFDGKNKHGTSVTRHFVRDYNP